MSGASHGGGATARSGPWSLVLEHLVGEHSRWSAKERPFVGLAGDSGECFRRAMDQSSLACDLPDTSEEA